MIVKNFLQDLVGKLLIEYGNKILSGECELNDDELENLVHEFAHERLTKEQACTLLNMSRSKFDDYVAKHKLPEGKKIRGFKELIWYRDELLTRRDNLAKLDMIHKLKNLMNK